MVSPILTRSEGLLRLLSMTFKVSFVPMPTLLLTCCVTLDKYFDFSELLLPYLKNRDRNTFLAGLLCDSNVPSPPWPVDINAITSMLMWEFPWLGAPPAHHTTWALNASHSQQRPHISGWDTHREDLYNHMYAKQIVAIILIALNSTSCQGGIMSILTIFWLILTRFE